MTDSHQEKADGGREADPKEDVQPFASQRVRFGLYALLTAAMIVIAAGTGQALSSYLAAAVGGLVASTLLDRVLEWLRYPDDSRIPWREGQGE